jgi:hypothetical protein
MPIGTVLLIEELFDMPGDLGLNLVELHSELSLGFMVNINICTCVFASLIISELSGMSINESMFPSVSVINFILFKKITYFYYFDFHNYINLNSYQIER